MEFLNFDNIGSKIKNLAKWSCWVTILLFWLADLVLFFILIANEVEGAIYLLLLLAAVVGPIVIWVGSWCMYAFGELVEDIHYMRDKSDSAGKANFKTAEQGKNETKKKNNKSKDEEFECLICKKKFTVSEDEDDAICPYCNTEFSIY